MDPRSGRSAADLLAAWWTLTMQAVAALAPGGPVQSAFGAPASSAGAVSVDVTGAAAPAIWRLLVDDTGELLEPAELWLRNPSADAVGPLRIDVADLRTVDGGSLPARCLRFDPEVMSELPARSARGVVVTLVVPVPLETGTYRGVLQIEGAPDVCLTLEAVVEVATAAATKSEATTDARSRDGTQ
jgi:hypothetical protein